MLENYSIHGCYQNVLWNWDHPNACSRFWLTTYSLCLVDVFSKRQSVLFWLPTVLLLDLTKSMCYVYVYAMHVDKAVEENDKCCFKSSANTCMLDLHENENENIIYFFVWNTVFNFAVFYKVIQAIYHRIILFTRSYSPNNPKHDYLSPSKW